jgi:hypothetical protein
MKLETIWCICCVVLCRIINELRRAGATACLPLHDVAMCAAFELEVDSQKFLKHHQSLKKQSYLMVLRCCQLGRTMSTLIQQCLAIRSLVQHMCVGTLFRCASWHRHVSARTSADRMPAADKLASLSNRSRHRSAALEGRTCSGDTLRTALVCRYALRNVSCCSRLGHLE